jgi:hypothetical protein
MKKPMRKRMPLVACLACALAACGDELGRSEWAPNPLWLAGADLDAGPGERVPRLDPPWTSSGSERAGAFFGWSMAGLGDVNGDGYPDVAVGAPYHSTASIRAGKVYVFHGGPTGLASQPAWTSSGDDFNRALFGYSVAAAGDVDGDGYADLLVGAPGHPTANANAGKAYLYRGSANGLLPGPSWTSTGDDQASAFFGTAVAGAGDVNKDGFADVLVGAPAESFEQGPVSGRTGKAFLYLGGRGGLAAAPAWTASASQAETGFAWSVAGAGDVNGDGYADWLVGANLHDGGASDSGRAFLYLGGGGTLSTQPAWESSGDPQAGAQFGHALAGAKDVNHDGYADLLIGAPGFDALTDENAGRAYLFLGGSSGPGAAAAWVQAGDRLAQFGWSLAGIGDGNRDGFADFLIGAPTSSRQASGAGAALLFLGRAEGADAQPAWSAAGDAQPGAGFGGAVAAAQDANGDGFGDFLVGAYGQDFAEADTGKAFLYLGQGGGSCNAPDDPCDDGDPCTRDDRCDGALVCRGTAYACDDNNGCTRDSCLGDGTCQYFVLDLEPCDDGNACTGPDICRAGVCRSDAKDCSSLGDACHRGECDPATGACRAVSLPDGTTCDDGDACTAGETCQGGVCHSPQNPCREPGVASGGGRPPLAGLIQDLTPKSYQASEDAFCRFFVALFFRCLCPLYGSLEVVVKGSPGDGATFVVTACRKIPVIILSETTPRETRGFQKYLNPFSLGVHAVRSTFLGVQSFKLLIVVQSLTSSGLSNKVLILVTCYSYIIQYIGGRLETQSYFLLSGRRVGLGPVNQMIQGKSSLQQPFPILKNPQKLDAKFRRVRIFRCEHRASKDYRGLESLYGSVF